jgi:hypothetical protein
MTLGSEEGDVIGRTRRVVVVALVLTPVDHLQPEMQRCR